MSEGVLRKRNLVRAGKYLQTGDPADPRVRWPRPCVAVVAVPPPYLNGCGALRLATCACRFAWPGAMATFTVWLAGKRTKRLSPSRSGPGILLDGRASNNVGLSGTQTKAGDTLQMLQKGRVSREDMFATARQNNTVLTWGLRAAGWLLMFLGMTLVAGPITTFGAAMGTFGGWREGGPSAAHVRLARQSRGSRLSAG